MNKSLSYDKWECSVADEIKQEQVWRFYGYRKALYLHDLVWQDCDRIARDYRGRALSNQLIRSASSVSANIEEGQGRGYYGKERNLFLRYAIASARETKGWYYRCRSLLGSDIIQYRYRLIDEIIGRLIRELQHQNKNK